ncbi:MAG: hypothetical protein H6686_04315 [Fibrobacteria bacterium]|nr:hypothetical protein [Fibrobacteria bacterium]
MIFPFPAFATLALSLLAAPGDSTIQEESIVTLPLGDVVPEPLPGSTPRIGQLHIEIHGALEGSRAISSGDSMVYVWADWARDHLLHNRTRRQTIARRLLFSDGDSLDSNRLAETERLLRTQRFLADARVRSTLDAQGQAVVTIETWDRWSTSILSSLNRSGGELQWLLGLSEANLLGSGRKVSGYYQSTALRESWNFSFADEAFLRQGHTLALAGSRASDGSTWSARLGRPLADRYQDWAWMLEFDDATYDRSVWGDAQLWGDLRRSFPAQSPSDWKGEPSGSQLGPLDARDFSSFQDFGALVTYAGSRTRKLRWWGSKVWGDPLRWSTGPLLEWHLDSTGIPLVGRQLPARLIDSIRFAPRWRGLREGAPEIDDRRIGWQMVVRQDRFVRRSNFNNLKWVEDIPVGWLLDGSVSQSVVSRGLDRDGTWLALSGRWTGFPGQTYLMASSAWVARTGGTSPHPDRQGWSWKSEARRLLGTQVQALATASGDLLLDAPFSSQLTLGEESGLPGYSAHSFAGTTRNLFGGEFRWTPPLEAFTIAPALAAFVGAGRVGDTPRLLGSGQWHYGAGIGLRFGLTRSISGVVNHLSLCRPLGAEGGDWNDLRGWMLSFGAKQSL